MRLGPGSRFGPYEVTGSLGAGGMGEVYRARDTKLQREVAVKVLPALFASDPDRLARFEREAQALAAFNHPHIAQIYGFVELTAQPGSYALVMELVDGEDLAERLARGPIAIEESVRIARQIAEALEAAHEHGIVHRDLKPANVKLTVDGEVKVLDFGLAKALSTDDAGRGGPRDLANSPTFTSPARLRHGGAEAGTEVGVILGTAAYMAPEQAAGKRVDRRADIWAFGCVLFEMLSGRRPFAGESLSETLAAIMRDPPDLSMLPAAAPAAVRGLIERCLEKDPRERLRDIGEARILLTRGVTPSAPAPALRARSPWLARAGWMAAGLVAGGATIAALMPRGAAPAPAVTSLRQLTELPGAEINPDISPDGREVLYASFSSGNSDLYLLRVGGGRAINLTAASQADDAQGAFSPEGDRIVFRSERDGGGIFVMGATGESVRRITSAGFDPRWSPDGKQVAYATEAVRDPYSRAVVSELWTVDVASGAAKVLGKGDAVQPSWSPSGTRIAFWSNIGGQRDIATIAAAGGEAVPVTRDAATDWAPEWSPDGRSLYFISDRGGSPNLWRVAIDQASGAVNGAPEPVTNGVRALASARFARDGSRMVLGATDRSFELALYSLDPANPERAALRSTIRSASLGWCAPSPDAAWLACTSRGGGHEDIVLLRSDGGETRRLTDDAMKDRIPIWAPDGRTLAFMSSRSGSWEQWVVGADGSGLRQLTDLKSDIAWGAFSPDGKQLAVAPVAGKSRMWFVNVAGPTAAPATTPVVVTGHEGAATIDAWSSDGALLAGTSLGPGGDRLGIHVWDARARRLLRTIETPMVRVTSRGLAFLPGSHTLVMGAPGGVTLVNADTGVTVRILPQTSDYGTSISGDGRTLLVERPSLEADLWLMELNK